MTAIKRSAQASLVFIQSGTLPPAGISQSWTATSCPASLSVQAIQCALVRSAELKLMKNLCLIEPHYRAGLPDLRFLLEFCFLVPVDDRSFPSQRECLDGPNQVWFAVSPSPAVRAARPRHIFPGPQADRRGCCMRPQPRDDPYRGPFP